MAFPRYRLRTLMMVVAVAAVISAVFSSSEGYQFVAGLLLPATLLTLSLAYLWPRPDWSRLATLLGIYGCAVGTMATIQPLRPLWVLYHVPVGTSMRPMALTFVLGVCAASGLLLAMPLSLACLALGWRSRRARWVGSLGILLSISAMTIGSMLFNWIVALRRFVLVD